MTRNELIDDVGANRRVERAFGRRDARLAWWETVLLGLTIGVLLGVWLAG